MPYGGAEITSSQNGHGLAEHDELTNEKTFPKFAPNLHCAGAVNESTQNCAPLGQLTFMAAAN